MEIIVSVPIRSSLQVKKKKSRKQKQSSGDQQSITDLCKLYYNLQKEHERVSPHSKTWKIRMKNLQSTWQKAKLISKNWPTSWAQRMRWSKMRREDYFKRKNWVQIWRQRSSHFIAVMITRNLSSKHHSNGQRQRQAAWTPIAYPAFTVGTWRSFRSFTITAAAWPMRSVSLDVRGALSGTSWRLQS